MGSIGVNERTVTGMDEYIERETVVEAFENADADVVEEYEDGACDWGFGRKNILEVINSVPAADVAPVRHGRWIEYTKVIIPEPYNKLEQAWKCSECGFDDGFVAYNYCPNCSAKMDGDVNA